jgi:hypothetical protein
VTCDGSTKDAGVTQADGFKVDCASAPTAIALGLRMYGVALQSIDVMSRAGSDKVYVFEFDPGDLGHRRFRGERLRQSEPDVLTMRYADTHIRELQGRTFRYVRSR